MGITIDSTSVMIPVISPKVAIPLPVFVCTDSCRPSAPNMIAKIEGSIAKSGPSRQSTPIILITNAAIAMPFTCFEPRPAAEGTEKTGAPPGAARARAACPVWTDDPQFVQNFIPSFISWPQFVQNILVTSFFFFFIG
jgi:hypothetical protein